MIVYYLHARRVLRRYHNRFALSFIGDRAPELDDAIPDNDIDQGNRRPRLLRRYRAAAHPRAVL